MPQNDVPALRNALGGATSRSDRSLWSAGARVKLADLATGSTLDGRLEELRGRSVLLVTHDQLSAALALIQIDGVARRIVLCPPDLDYAHLPYVIATAAIDAIVSDQEPAELGTGSGLFVKCSSLVSPAPVGGAAAAATEWVLFTSGTSGTPKMVSHNLASLAGAIAVGSARAGAFIWSTFYDIRRYGGLQIFLRALLGGGSLLLSDGAQAANDFLARAGAHGVTHITGTPSHWRRAIMSGAAHQISPQYVRLSGEIADQPILDSLRMIYPHAIIAHAYASTEAGVGFEIEDGLAGIPATYFTQERPDVRLKVQDGSLRIRSSRTALHYIGASTAALMDDDGFVDTGDILQLRDGRYYFSGRRGGIINVGGLKVHPEEVEAVINRHPRVQMSLVKSRRSPVTGAVVVAEIVLKSDADPDDANGQNAALKGEILADCQRSLAAHKVPAAIRIVASLAVTPSGKVSRADA